MATTIGTQPVTGQPKVVSPTIKTGILTIRNDLREFRYNLEQLMTLTDSNIKWALFNDTIKLFSQFDVAEEVVLYSALRNLGLITLADKGVEQTINMDKLLYELDQKYGSGIEDSGKFRTDIGRLRDVFNIHASWLEGQDVLQKLERKLTREDIDSFSTWFDRVKTMAPTRPPRGDPCGHPCGHSCGDSCGHSRGYSCRDSCRDSSSPG